jgi:tetraacyldisaccharide 4'-kinase
MHAPDFWRGPGVPPAAWALRPFAAIYGGLAAARLNQPGPRANLPTLVVGGLTAGGDGKTPTALALARLLIGMGERPAFLTRGYGREVRSRVSFIVDPARHGFIDAGDEALLLARVAPTIVGANRVASARLAQEGGASVLILDDGQHSRALASDLALLVVDAAYGAGNGLCLPAGPLRAPLAAQVATADAVLIIGDGVAGDVVAALAQKMGKPGLLAKVTPTMEAAARYAGQRVFAFAGVARPEKFLRSLQEVGASVVGTRWFGDHHRISESEMTALEDAADGEAAQLVTTEKDAARLASNLERADTVEVLGVELVWEDPQSIVALVSSSLETRRVNLSR